MAAEDPHNEQSTDIEVRSPSLLEKAIRKKWWIYGGTAIAAIYVGAVLLAAGGQEEPEPEPEFSDTLPEVRDGQQDAIATLQDQLGQTQDMLDEQQEQMKSQQERYERQIAALEEELDSQDGDSADGADKEARDELLARIEELEEQQRSGASTGTDGTEGDDKADDSGDKRSPEDYMRPPRMSDSEDREIVPPPPVERGDDDQGRDLPPRTGGEREEGGPATPDHGQPTPPEQAESGRDEPWKLDGSEQVSADDERVMAGAEDEGEEDRPGAKKAGFIPMGSFSEVALLTGADFGAGERAQSDPQPILMRLQDNAILPGRARYELTDCFAMGSGYGDLSSERAYIQLARISCVNQDEGTMMESQLQGYVVDSDGRLGLRGDVERRSGAMLGKAMMAGFAEGASSILSTAASETEQVATGAGMVQTSIDEDNLAESGLYGGAGEAMSMLAERYIQEAESMFPVIEVPPGRKGTVVIQIGQHLQWESYDPQDMIPAEEKE